MILTVRIDNPLTPPPPKKKQRKEEKKKREKAENTLRKHCGERNVGECWEEAELQ